ncbi:hypothetical protein PanWU01x14_219880 [Parasponia andersonii]|uniref:Uncharacterized protein n=1 Tax=Parasponia andersonii TaxID=3476 RepID=A0A2P5BQA0_PARAD|nr:hypothetical protein PanWU01x14_219880 [Parasponia andersonii]
MAGGGAETRPADGDDRSLAALWIVVNGMEKKLDARFEALTRKIRLVLAQIGTTQPTIQPTSQPSAQTTDRGVTRPLQHVNRAQEDEPQHR